jgi:hypothetical protein
MSADEPRKTDRGEGDDDLPPPSLGLMFVAAGAALVALLAVIALIAYAALSSSPPARGAPSPGALSLTPASRPSLLPPRGA